MELDDSFSLLPEGGRHAESEGRQDGSGESSGPGPTELYSRRPRSLPAPLFEDSMHSPMLENQAAAYTSRGPPSYLMPERHLGSGPYAAQFPGRSGDIQASAGYLARANAGMPQVGMPALFA